MSNVLLRSVGPIAGLILGLFLGLYVLGSNKWGGCSTMRDTLVVARTDTLRPSPDTVWIKTKPRVAVDSTYGCRIDSLLASIANRDSLIRSLAETKEGQQPFSTKAQTSSGDTLSVTGLALIECRPLDNLHRLILTPDPIYLKSRDTTIVIREVVEVLDGRAIAISIVGGALVGAAIVYTLKSTSN